MRLVGMALLAAWLMAWAVSPHGEVARPTSIVGAVACAGGDRAAAAWLELRHGAVDGTLHVVTVDEADRVAERLRLPAGVDATGFKLTDAGQGRFVLATEHRGPMGGFVEFHRFGIGGGDDAPPRIHGAAADLDENGRLTRGLEWQVAAAGAELVVLVTVDGKAIGLHVLNSSGDWDAERLDGERVLIGAGGGHAVIYREGVEGVRGATLNVSPRQPGEWVAEVGRPACLAGGDGGSTVTSVVGLRGGYARLSRRGAVGCVDGIRDGKSFSYRDVPLAGIGAARLSVDEAGGLSVHEEQDAAQITQRRVILPEQPGAAILVDPRTVHSDLRVGGVRYRLFAGAGRLGVTTLATRVTDGETQVVLERNGFGDARVLAPMRRYQPDHRPALRALSLAPILLLVLAAFGTWKRWAQVRRLTPLPADVPFGDGQVTVEGELAVDAEAPAGGLRLRRGRSGLTLFIEGADVLRASDVRPRSQPRGDAVDVASGATVVATGVVDPGALYRDEATMRARSGDLVLVGCTLEEARTRIARSLLGSIALVCFASSLILALTTG